MSVAKPMVAETDSPARLPLRRGLIATDFSAGSERGWQRAVRLPLAAGANLHVVHVLPEQERRTSRIDAMLEDYAAKELRKTVQAMDGALRRAGHRDVEVTTEIVHGTAYTEIVRAARASRSELIVLGRQGRQGLRHFLLGSTAERVVWSSPVPVLVVQGVRPQPYRRLLVALDDSAAARAAMRAGMRLAAEAARVDVVRATDLSHLLVAKNVGASVRRVRELAARDQRQAEREVARLLGELGGDDLDVRLTVRNGHASTVILDELRRRQPALVALGTHSRSGLQRAVLGSVAETVVRRAVCDVLIVRGEAPASARSVRRPRTRAAAGDRPRSGPVVIH